MADSLAESVQAPLKAPPEYQPTEQLDETFNSIIGIGQLIEDRIGNISNATEVQLASVKAEINQVAA